MLVYQAFLLITFNQKQLNKYSFTEFFGKFSAILVTQTHSANKIQHQFC